MALRRLSVDFEALARAMIQQGSDEYDYYLDTETGRIMRIATEVWNALEEGQTIAGSLAGWQQEELREAQAVFSDTQGRYILIPDRADWEAEAEELMADFVDGVQDAELQKKLRGAMQGRNIVRRFNDALAQHAPLQQQWQALQKASEREYMVQWLQDEGIEAG